MASVTYLKYAKDGETMLWRLARAEIEEINLGDDDLTVVAAIGIQLGERITKKSRQLTSRCS